MGLGDGFVVAQRFVDEVARVRDLRTALVRLRDSMRSNIWKTAGAEINLGRTVRAFDSLTRRDGFHVMHDWDGIADRVNEDTIPVDVLNYLIEQRRGNFPTHTLADFLSYIFLMPIFTAGPIERFEHFIANRETRFHVDQVVEGVFRIAVGVIKKFWAGTLVAEAMQQVTGGTVLTMLEHLNLVSPHRVWAYLFLALISIYLDFSAYTDIAIGASRLFGLRIMENFNLPFIAEYAGDEPV